MRIAFITPEFVTEEYFSGGLANYVHRITKYLASLGHEVHVIILSNDKIDSFLYGDVWIHPVIVKDRRPLVRCLIRRFLYVFSQWLAFAFKAWRKLSRLNKEAHFDIVQVSNYRASGLFVCLFSNIPHVLRISSFQKAWDRAAERYIHFGVKATEWLEILQIKLCKNVYAPSQALASMLGKEADIAEVKVIQSPYYLETDNWDTSFYNNYLAGKKYILFFGRLDVYKGIKVIANALPKVLESIPECEVVFIGKDVNISANYTAKNLICDLSAKQTHRLHFFDQVTHDRLYPVISGAWLVVLPSFVDNLPNALIESMALGKPVIGTIGASFDEVIIDKKNGFLVPIGDSGALANKINQAWNDPNLKDISENATQTIKQFRPEITVKILLEYYNRIINHWYRKA